MSVNDIKKDGADEQFDDIHIESYNDDVLNGSQSTPEEKIKKLKEKLKQTEKEKEEYLDGWQRAKADFVNYKKREEEGKEEFMKFSREAIISELLPVLESFDMAFSNKEAWQKVESSWRVGVEYIHNQLATILKDNGLSEIDPSGAMFDPKEHTAVSNVPTKEKDKVHKVASVVQKGYRLNGKMLRSPKVKVFEEVQPKEGS